MPTPGEDERVERVEYAETIKILRRALRAAFPGTKFSVTRCRGTSYGWIEVRWSDGPRYAQVNPLVLQFEGRSFDGMTDGYRTNQPTRMTLPGNTAAGLYRFDCCGVGTTRTMGPAGYAAVAEHINHLQPGAVHADGTTLHGRITEDTWARLEVTHHREDLEAVAWEIFCRLTIPA